MGAPLNRRQAIALATAIALSPLSLAPAAWALPAKASHQEDQPGWSCVDDGNRVCGPGNDEGKPAGCYDDGGVLFAVWPCEAWKPSDGYHI